MNEKIPFMRTDFDAVVVANGVFPRDGLPLSVLSHLRDDLFCCDGAANRLMKAGFIPKAVIGDGDSILPQVRSMLSDRFIKLSEQENNDLTKTVHHCVLRGYKRLCILGATGNREDHTLGNISLLADYMDLAEVEMWTDNGTITPAVGNVEFESYGGQQVSIFCFEPKPLTVHGLRWKIENRILTRWWQASLNEAEGDSFKIETSGKVVVFRQYHLF